MQLHVHHHGIPKGPIRGFDRIYDIALQDLPGNPPSSLKDHRKAKKLCLSRYGERWVEKLKSSFAMSKFCCITNLICFMMNEVEKLMKGSVHKDDLFIVNDVLTLMTAKGKNQLDETKRVITFMVASPQWTVGWDSLSRPSCW